MHIRNQSIKMCIFEKKSKVMKKIAGICFVLSGLFILGSCGGSDKTASVEKKYSYSYNPESSILEFTAFKFTNRTGVKGTFNEINISGLSKSNDKKELVESLGFNIPTNTVETNDPGRNAKIAEFFFAAINTDVIEGKVLKLKDDGGAEVSIKMNGITKTVVGEYVLSDTQFSFHAKIDVANWNGEKGIVSLNEQCVANHTGEDGILKLWSEVELSFTTVLNRTEVKE